MLTSTYPDMTFNIHMNSMYASTDLSQHDILDFCSPKSQSLLSQPGTPAQGFAANMINQTLQQRSPSTSPSIFTDTTSNYIIPSQRQQDAPLPNSGNNNQNNRRNTYDATVTTGTMLSHEMTPTSLYQQQPFSSSSSSIGLPMMSPSPYSVNNTMHDPSLFAPSPMCSQPQLPYRQSYNTHNRVYSSPSSLSLHQFRSVPNLSPLLNSSYDMHSPMVTRRCSLSSFSRPPSPQYDFSPLGCYQQSQQQQRSTSPTTSTTAGNKKYMCRVCNKRFTRPSSLTTHIYSHTGEKPFKCPIENCGRSFSVVSNLRRHAKVHGMANFDNYNNSTTNNKTIRRTMSSATITMNNTPFP